MAKQMVMAGLKWPPEVGPHMMMAKANSYGECPTDLEDGTECGDTEGAGAIESEGGDRCNAREDIEEDPSCFGHALSEDTGTSGFEAQFALGDGFMSGYLAGEVPLQGVGHGNL